MGRWQMNFPALRWFVAAAIIEELGGMDPLQRNLDPRTPEFGVAP